MIEVREYKPADLPTLLKWGESFVGSAYEADFNDVSFKATLEWILDDNGFVLVAEQDGKLVGAAAAIVAPKWWNMDKIQATEVFWWVAQEARSHGVGRLLLDAIEDEARMHDVDELIMVSSEDLDMAGAYQRRGFKIRERHFWRAL